MNQRTVSITEEDAALFIELLDLDGSFPTTAGRIRAELAALKAGQGEAADITELMRQARWKIEELSDAMENLTEDDPEDGTSEILIESRDIMSKIDAMLAAAPTAKKESGDE